MSMANVGNSLWAGLAHARRSFDIVLEVEDALCALVPEHPHAVETGGVVAVPVAEQQVHTGNLGLFSDSLGDHVHDRNRFQVREIPDGEALAAAGLGRRRLGHRRLSGLDGGGRRPDAAGSVASAAGAPLAGSVDSAGPDSARIGDAATSIVGITTNSADNLRLIIHFPSPRIPNRQAGIDTGDVSGRRYHTVNGPALTRGQGCTCRRESRGQRSSRSSSELLWLATRMIDAANRERPPPAAPPGRDGGVPDQGRRPPGILGIDGRDHDCPVVRPPTRRDKVAVKPHASPVFHAIKYLTGELDTSYLRRLRDFGGLQAYPSRTKDPDVADFSTGSVGLGATAPLFAAAARRYIESHFGPVTDRPARFIALVGDAELDEGNVWEAITDPALQGLGNVMWVVDVNRQSLDRVIPEMKIHKLMRVFEDSGWHVVEAKYGQQLRAAFERPGGAALRHHLDDMSNEKYQSLFRSDGCGAPRPVLRRSAQRRSRCARPSCRMTTSLR